jgi:hypothetical protein
MEMKTRLQINRTLTELGTFLVRHVLSEAFPVLVLIKMGTALILVMLLTFLAEVVSTRFAGILSGYPMGAALSLFFLGFEISPPVCCRKRPLYFPRPYRHADLRLLLLSKLPNGTDAE